MAIVAMTLLCIVMLMVSGLLPMRLGGAMLGGGILVVLVAWREDHRGVSILWRGICYLAAPAFSVYLMGGVDALTLDGRLFVAMGFAGNLLIIIALSWLINLYNFMDGADGLAAVQAMATSLPGGFLFCLAGHHALGMICFVIAAAALGFLFWNWAPAKLFMGDVGSCFLGFMFGMLMLAGEYTDSVPVPVWLVLLAIFIWDATLTLLKRLVAGETWYAAHKQHAFQKLLQMRMSHSTLALWVLALNVIVLWPLALVAHTRPPLAPYMVFASMVIMTAVWLAIQAIWLKQAPK